MRPAFISPFRLIAKGKVSDNVTNKPGKKHSGKTETNYNRAITTNNPEPLYPTTDSPEVDHF